MALPMKMVMNNSVYFHWTAVSSFRKVLFVYQYLVLCVCYLFRSDQEKQESAHVTLASYNSLFSLHINVRMRLLSGFSAFEINKLFLSYLYICFIVSIKW